jgi:hypothetical protein
MTADAEAVHLLLLQRWVALEGCTEGSEGEAELKAFVDVVEACEAKRWPLGREPGG